MDSPKRMPDVAPPLSKTPLNRFVYYMAIIVAGIGAFYAYRISQLYHSWKTPLTSNTASGGIEDHIHALADAFGVPASNLAFAIAEAVREHVPPASIASVAAKETGTLIQALVGSEPTPTTGYVGQVVNGLVDDL